MQLWKIGVKELPDRVYSSILCVEQHETRKGIVARALLLFGCPGLSDVLTEGLFDMTGKQKHKVLELLVQPTLPVLSLQCRAALPGRPCLPSALRCHTLRAHG